MLRRGALVERRRKRAAEASRAPMLLLPLEAVPAMLSGATPLPLGVLTLPPPETPSTACATADAICVGDFFCAAADAAAAEAAEAAELTARLAAEMAAAVTCAAFAVTVTVTVWVWGAVGLLEYS